MISKTKVKVVMSFISVDILYFLKTKIKIKIQTKTYIRSKNIFESIFIIFNKPKYNEGVLWPGYSFKILYCEFELKIFPKNSFKELMFINIANNEVEIIVFTFLAKLVLSKYKRTGTSKRNQILWIPKRIKNKYKKWLFFL